MKQKLFSLLVSVFISMSFFSCKSRESSSLKENVSTNVTNEYLGCFKIADATSNTTNAALKVLLKAKEVCIVGNPTVGSGRSRSGTYSFTFKKADGEVINTLGMDWSQAQPRCPSCYAFAGFEGSAIWNGEQTGEPINLDMDLRSYQANVTFKLSRPDQKAAEYLGCFKVARASADETNGALELLLKAKQVCIEDTTNSDGVSRSGSYSFTFKRSDGAVINTLGMDWSQAQPRCPSCYAFNGLDGSAIWDGEQSDEPIKLEMDLRSYQAKATFELAR